MVIELTKITKQRLVTIELKQNTGKPRRDVDGQNWRGLKKDYIWVNLKNVAHLFQIYITLYQNVILHSWKIILSCYVVVILQMKDSCSVTVDV